MAIQEAPEFDNAQPRREGQRSCQARGRQCQLKPELVFWPFQRVSINPLALNRALPGKYFLPDIAGGFQPLFPGPKNSSPGHPEPACSDTSPFLWDIGIIFLGGHCGVGPPLCGHSRDLHPVIVPTRMLV